MKKFMVGFISGSIFASYWGLRLLLNNQQFKNALTDSLEVKIRKWVYGPDSQQARRSYGPVVYRGRYAPRYTPPSSIRDPAIQNAYKMATRDDAEKVLESMRKILVTYSFVSLADFRELMKLPCVFTDSQIGWTNLDEVKIKATYTGYILDLPKPEPIPVRE